MKRKKTIIALASGLVLSLGLACFAACGDGQGDNEGEGGVIIRLRSITAPSRLRT